LLDRDFETAEAHLRQAITLGGDDPATFIQLGAMMLHLGQHERAETYYRSALALDGESADAHAGIGLAQLAHGDAQQAERNIRVALHLRYDAPALHYQLGVICAGQKRWADAARALQTALAQYPGLREAETLLRRVQDQIASRLADTMV
jgi:Flp pilus assembly protein TadD